MSTAAVIPMPAEAAPQESAPVPRNLDASKSRKSTKKFPSLRKMMKKLTSSKKVTQTSRSTKTITTINDASDKSANSPVKVVLETASSAAPGIPKLEMVLTEDVSDQETTDSSCVPDSDSDQEQPQQQPQEPVKEPAQATATQQAEPQAEVTKTLEEAEGATVEESVESESESTLPEEPTLKVEEESEKVVEEVKEETKTINYEVDDEVYVPEKEMEKTPCTPSDAVALFLASALIAAQAFL